MTELNTEWVPPPEPPRWYGRYSAVMEKPDGDDLMAAYVAGVIDGGSSIGVQVKKASNRHVGYEITPRIRLKRDDTRVLEVIGAWAIEHDIEPGLTHNSNGAELTITAREDLETFLRELQPYLLVQDEVATILLDEILPALREGKHNTQAGFMEVMESVERVREYSEKSDHKYDIAYFEDLWELTDTAQ